MMLVKVSSKQFLVVPRLSLGVHLQFQAKKSTWLLNKGSQNQIFAYRIFVARLIHSNDITEISRDIFETNFLYLCLLCVLYLFLA